MLDNIKQNFTLKNFAHILVELHKTQEKHTY